MTAYFDKAQVASHLLIDLATMKVFYRQAGGDINTASSQMQAFLAAHP